MHEYIQDQIAHGVKVYASVTGNGVWTYTGKRDGQVVFVVKRSRYGAYTLES